VIYGVICEYDAMSVRWSVRVVCCVWWCEMEAMCDIACTLGKALVQHISNTLATH
jgi:hypothetical protein